MIEALEAESFFFYKAFNGTGRQIAKLILCFIEPEYPGGLDLCKFCINVFFFSIQYLHPSK